MPESELTIEEIAALAKEVPSLIALYKTIKQKVKDAQLDGKVSAEEIGGVLAVAGPPLGKLIDEIIAATSS